MRFLWVTGLIVITALAYIAYPYWTVQRIDAAIVGRDAASLETLIDWPQVRSGLKADVRGLLSGPMGSGLDDATAQGSGATALGSMIGTMLAGSMVDAMIDGYVSAPRVIEAWQQRGRRPIEFMRWAWFQSPSAFRVDLRADQPEVPTVSVILEFSGLSWRVTRLVIPIREIERTAAAMRSDGGTSTMLRDLEEAIAGGQAGSTKGGLQRR
jgi:hypothetical protein